MLGSTFFQSYPNLEIKKLTTHFHTTYFSYISCGLIQLSPKSENP